MRFEQFGSELAVDGHTGPEWDGGHCSAIGDLTSPRDPAWWFVDLKDAFTVYGVTVHSASSKWQVSNIQKKTLRKK